MFACYIWDIGLLELVVLLLVTFYGGFLKQILKFASSLLFFMWAGRGRAPSQSDPFWLISWVFVWFGWVFLQPKFPDA